MEKLKILINAYACSPDMGSEPGMGWNWCTHLAKYCELHIITEGEFREKIEAALPNLPQGKNMHFYYNPVSEEVRKMCWNQGDWRFYIHYKEWQKKTLDIIKQIMVEHKIDILHQLNMIGFREPGYLWKIKDVPFVWGPVNAKDGFPINFLEGTKLKTKLFNHLKNLITGFQLQYSRRVRKAAQQASFVISASSDSRKNFKKYFNIDSPVLNETGCKVIETEPINKIPHNDKLNILWVGKMDFLKQLGLALQSIAMTNISDIVIHIVGGGNDAPYKKLADSLNIADQCIWYGLVPHKTVQSLMRESDLLFFTSVSEGTPHAVLEAVSNNLPVVCFDTCGQGDTINEKVGVKIPLTNPKQSVKDFADALRFLFHNRETLTDMSQNCKQLQNELSWENKALAMVNYYKKALSPT